MNIAQKITTGLCISLIVVFFCSIACFGAASQKELNIVFLHDIHSHVEEGRDSEGDSIGGLARIRTIIREKESEGIPLLTVDGGDFSMGTLYQTIYTTQAPELRLMGAMGIDVTTLGNHEFDYRTDGMVSMLRAAKESGDRLPELVASNIVWSEEDKEDSDAYKLKKAFEEYGGKSYTMLQKGDISIAVFGEFGKDADNCAPMSGQTFEDICKNAKEVVAEIKANENPDMIVCLSHSGTNEDSSKSEDELLASAVPEIDLIVSAHTHTVLAEPILVGETTIASCGSYGRKAGTLRFVQKENGRWEAQDYTLIDINDSIPRDAELMREIASYEDDLDNYTALFGFPDRAEVLAQSPIEFTDNEVQSTKHEEYPLANLICDSYIYRIEESEGVNGEPIDIAIVPSGCIRSTIHKGDVTVADVFEILSLGVGEDGIPGYPLVNLYVTGKELKSIMELDASVAPLQPEYQLYFSGVKMTYNKNRMIFNKALDVKLVDRDGNETEVEDKKLYRVVTDYYSAQMVGAVQDTTKNIIQITPRNKDGSAITNMKQNIILEDGNEIKAWEAVASYLKSFSKVDGVSVIPEEYAQMRGLKTDTDSHKLTDILKNPNSFCIMLCGAVLLILALIVFLIRFIVKGIRTLARRTKASSWRKT